MLKNNNFYYYLWNYLHSYLFIDRIDVCSTIESEFLKKNVDRFRCITNEYWQNNEHE